VRGHLAYAAAWERGPPARVVAAWVRGHLAYAAAWERGPPARVVAAWVAWVRGPPARVVEAWVAWVRGPPARIVDAWERGPPARIVDAWERGPPARVVAAWVAWVRGPPARMMRCAVDPHRSAHQHTIGGGFGTRPYNAVTVVNDETEEHCCRRTLARDAAYLLASCGFLGSRRYRVRYAFLTPFSSHHLSQIG